MANYIRPSCAVCGHQEDIVGMLCCVSLVALRMSLTAIVTVLLRTSSRLRVPALAATPGWLNRAGRERYSDKKQSNCVDHLNIN